ncbi:hypothetical protein BT049_RS13360 [Vibrio parahaemolyticus]|nr:hypothetical protein [Vibrio parahaemolyticus]ELA7162268.1 hypothetical protein [Vibrio parahaemolyticus]
MLELRDSLTNESVWLSSGDEIGSGRYYLVKDAQLDIHGRLPAGSLLVDDGRGFLEVDGIALGLISPLQDLKDTGDRSVSLIALEELYQLTDLGDATRLPSPVIPAEMSRRFDRTRLERKIIDVFGKGYLHFIAKSPRMSMRYDEELLPVSRAKRIASDSQRHLAAHSECWQQRTFTGIVPKKLKAKISEDEIHIYENRVYARLLDHLERYTLNKLAEFCALNKTLSEGIELEGSSSLHRHLRYAICNTWGESFSHNQAEELKSLSESQLEVFESILRNVQQLKQSGTYRNIPGRAQVPLSLKATNILNNDPYYLKVRELWNLWVDEVASFSRDPITVFKQNINQCRYYERYIGLLLLRAHQKLGWEILGNDHVSWMVRHASGISASIMLESGVWKVLKSSVDSKASLELIPCLHTPPVNSIPGTNLEERYVCVLDELPENKAFLQCSPTNLFTEESLIQVVQQWWLRIAAESYGKKVKSISKVICESWPEHQVSGQFKSIPNVEDADFIKSIKKQHLSDQQRESLEKIYLAACFVSHCPCCGRKVEDSNFNVRERRAFLAKCSCGSEWQMRWTGGEWLFEVGDKETSESTIAGHWSCSLNMGSTDFM